MSATAGRSTPRGGAATSAGAEQARALTPAEIAWIALIPCALVMLAAIVVLGPPLGHVLVRPGSDALWPPTWWNARGNPEPAKHGRYVLAVLAPVLLVGLMVAGARREVKLRPQAIRAIALTSQAALLAFVVFGALGQHDVILGEESTGPVFGVGVLAAAAGLVAVALLGLRRPGVTDRIARLARETTTRRAAGIAIAGVLSAVVLLEAVTTDRLVEDVGQMNWTLNDAFAVLDGRTPLVDYHLIYAKLLPYPAALALWTFGTTALVYTTFMAILGVLTLLAVYAIFRRVVRSSLLALALFVPFVAMGDVQHTMTMPAMWPMRYGGAYLLAWLTVRHVDRRSPRRAWIVFFVSGFVVVNNVEFGMGALLATVAALLCARPPESVRAALRLGAEVVGGVVGAIAVISLFTLVRAGTLPKLDVLLEWPRIFTNLGWFSLPIPTAGLYFALYATFVAAIVVAAVRLIQAGDDRMLTSMLMWSGVFGLVAGSYYLGRSEDLKLVSMFSAWAFALLLLTVVCVQALAAREWRAPQIAELLVLFGVALAVCAVGWLSPPWHEAARLSRAMPAPQYRAAAEQFVAARVRRGETVAITLPEGHRIAYDLGLENVAPYGIQNAIVTQRQMRTLLDTLQREHVRELFVPGPLGALAEEGQTAPQQLERFVAAGYRPRSERLEMIELRAGP